MFGRSLHSNRSDPPMPTAKAYNVDLPRNAANFAPLTPVSFLDRAAAVYPARPAVIYGERVFVWREIGERCARLASAMRRLGVGYGDTVAALLPNIPAMYELHFATPMLGAVLNALNTRLDPATIAAMLDHGEAKILFVDREFSAIVRAALPLLRAQPPILVHVDDPDFAGGEAIGDIDYEGLLGGGDAAFRAAPIQDEWDAIALNYTSGTTGDPKGVVYHHRGAYLNAVSNIVTWGMPPHSAFLWTVPMFHCNGWCFPWTMAANAGVNVCLRRVDAKAVVDLIRRRRVTHFCGAPVVHRMLIDALKEDGAGLGHPVSALIAGAPPPPAIIEGMERLGVSITHVYGLTETYGPAAVCAKHAEWDELPLALRAELNGRQGVRSLMQESVEAVDPTTLAPAPRDGRTMGEIVFRGNLVMKGYLKNEAATKAAFDGGCFHSGDLAVVEPDGYLKIRDRAKDVIISGGENISSVEVEEALYRHPDVAAAAVVAMPDAKWGEAPCAYVELREGAVADGAALAQHCRAHLAHFKAPKQFIFGALPKTATGKIQKYLLRLWARSAEAIE
jgi:fatty-acyl-CoA synthase